MKPVLIFVSKYTFLSCEICLLLFFLGCGSSKQGLSGTGNKYQYIYVMSVPSDSQKVGYLDPSNLFYQDDSLIIQFKFDESALHLQLQNLANSYLVLDWAKVRILYGGRESSVRSSLGFYSDSTRRPISASLPPLGLMRDYLAPKDNVYFDGSKWTEKELFPTWDNWSPEGVTAIRKRVKESVLLKMPVWFGSFYRTYVFRFEIKSFEAISLQNYRPPWRDPKPSKEKLTSDLQEQLTTAAIIVGVVGFSVYMISLKKDTPADIQ